MTNKVSAEITEAMMAEFKQDIEKIKAKYPWFISLTPEERSASIRIGDKSNTLVSKVLEYNESHPEYMPVYVDKVEMKKDFKLWGDLTTMGRTSALLTESINDTAIQAGNEAMEAALAYYNSVRDAAKHGASEAQTIYDDLKARFQGRTPKKEAPKK
ncbi:hypothetical protein [uncultured Acetobacteroides sp.]|uniref:hypothetical protein n=1 Tax=uncultured Acetobacteroides sp. TaxID=1760811 RepID=UPI0029F5A7D5|nr:hypothetical protein [uncultured Acetobacteroides sp.]